MSGKKEETMKAERQEISQKRLCDYCDDSTAILYCRADSAKLCISCDREVHSTNQLFSKHTRSLLCDSCDASPASIFCETEQSVFCQNCDWERHQHLSLSSVHNRRPIEGFNGFPSVSELVSFLGFEYFGDKKDEKKAFLFKDEAENDTLMSAYGRDDGSGFVDGYSKLFVWENSPVVSIDDLIVSSDSGPNFRALGVPPLPKNRNAVCGQFKEEILRQLRELAGLEPDFETSDTDTQPVNRFYSDAGQTTQAKDNYTDCDPDGRPNSFPGCQEDIFYWLSDNGEPGNQEPVPCTLPRHNVEEEPVVPDKPSVVDGGLMTSILPKFGHHEINSQERDSAISRYKEKRKTRRYDKHIRYESRKLRAESRTRIKGRFAKMNISNNCNQLDSSSIQ